MLIEQIIKFELRGLSSQVVHVIVQFTLKTGYFHDKTKIFKANLQVSYYLLLKYCSRQRTHLFPELDLVTH